MLLVTGGAGFIGSNLVAGLNEAETAVALDLARGTVKSRTARALDKLRISLENRDPQRNDDR